MRRRERGWPIPPPAPRTTTLVRFAAEAEKARDAGAVQTRAAERANIVGWRILVLVVREQPGEINAAGCSVDRRGVPHRVTGCPPLGSFRARMLPTATGMIIFWGSSAFHIHVDAGQNCVGICLTLLLLNRLPSANKIRDLLLEKRMRSARASRTFLSLPNTTPLVDRICSYSASRSRNLINWVR